MSTEVTERPVRRKAAPSRRPAPTKKRPPAKKTVKKRRPARPKRQAAKARTRIAFGKIFGRTFFKRLAISVAAALLLVLVLMAFLRVRTVSVVGNSLYTTAEIQEATGIGQGSALLLVNKTAVASRIKAQLPYIDDVRIGISLPDTVKLEVVELDTTYAVAADDGSYWLMNSAGKLVEQITAKEASEYLTIVGVRITGAEVGQTIEVLEETAPEQPEEEAETEEEETDEEEPELDKPPEASAGERMDLALKIIAQLEEVDDIRSITSIDVSSVYDLEIWYGTRFQVKLGDSTELSYKLEYMVAALAQLESYQSGVLDLTFKEAKKATFIPWSN